MSMPVAVWLCSNPEHTREFYVEEGGLCPVPGCDGELVEYGWLGVTPEHDDRHRWWRVRISPGPGVVWEGVDDEDAAFAALERSGPGWLEMRDSLDAPWECIAKPAEDGAA